MAFKVKCETCKTELGEVADLVGMTDLVMAHMLSTRATGKSCHTREITITCTGCLMTLTTSPLRWSNKGGAEDAADHDHLWELQHNHSEVH